jgi:hypothetical protein
MEKQEIVPMHIREAKFNLSDYMVRRKIKETYQRKEDDGLSIRSIIDKIWYFYPEADITVKNENEIIVNREGRIIPKFNNYSYMSPNEADEAIERDDYMYQELMERKVDTHIEEGYDSSRIMMDELMEAIWSIEPQAEIDVMDLNHLVAKYSWEE